MSKFSALKAKRFAKRQVLPRPSSPPLSMCNWEQGRREPTGAAKALLRAIHNDPEHVIQALCV